MHENSCRIVDYSVNIHLFSDFLNVCSSCHIRDTTARCLTQQLAAEKHCHQNCSMCGTMQILSNVDRSRGWTVLAISWMLEARYTSVCPMFSQRLVHYTCTLKSGRWLIATITCANRQPEGRIWGVGSQKKTVQHHCTVRTCGDGPTCCISCCSLSPSSSIITRVMLRYRQAKTRCPISGLASSSGWPWLDQCWGAWQ